MNTKQVNKSIQKTTINVPHYINSNCLLNVTIIAKSDHTRLSVILAEIADNVYQDFYYSKSENAFKILTEYGDYFGSWWDEEGVSELIKMPIFKDFKNEKANFNYLKNELN